jgi:MoaA/NifB/PqqE/SkfB family radical SAM enzyme
MDLATSLFAARTLFGYATGSRLPLLVQMNLTNRCNSRCRYCYAEYHSRPSDEMTLDSVKQVIDFLRAAGLFRLNLVGGEPLLRKDIDRIIAHAKAGGVQCAMTTNGSLLARRVHEIRELDLVCVSIDGRPDNSDCCRGQGAHDRAIDGIEACRAAGIPVQISSVLTRHTVGDVDYLVDLADRFGCRVGFAILIGARPDSQASQAELMPTDAQVRAALGRILELKAAGRPILFSARAYRHSIAWPDYSREFAIGRAPEGIPTARCHAGRRFCLVDTNGDVYPCPQMVGIVKPLNLLVHGLDAALERAASHGCAACAIPCSIDFNLFFDLDPETLVDHFLAGRRR